MAINRKANREHGVKDASLMKSFCNSKRFLTFLNDENSIYVKILMGKHGFFHSWQSGW